MRHFRFVGALAGLLVAGCTFNFVPAPQPLKQVTVHGSKGPRIALIDIEGVLTEGSQQQFFGPAKPSQVARLRESLKAAASDKKVAGVILRVRSPGGTVSASEVMYHEVMAFKKETNKPVIAYIQGIGASGGYYVAMAADEIIAHPATITGSIGVVFWGVNLTGLFEKIGIKDQTLKSGEFKDAGSWTREMKPEERAQIQSVIDDFHSRFKSVVQAGRPNLTGAQIDKAADGRIYSAKQARELGLVDRIGHVDVALSRMKQRIGAQEIRVVTYQRPGEYRGSIYTHIEQNDIKVEAMNFGRRSPSAGGTMEPGFYYLWMPNG